MRWVAVAVAATVGLVLLSGFTAQRAALTSQASGGAACEGAAVPAVSGKWSQRQISELWVAEGGSTGSTQVSGIGPVPDPTIAGAVGMAESGGDATIVNGIGAGGLMQIHPPEPNYLDPATNMKIAVRKWKASGWQPWQAFTGADGSGDDGPWRTQLTVGSPDGPPAPPDGTCGVVTASLANLIAEADRMTALHQPYTWGGGHGAFSPDGPWDCSGAVSQLLHHLGLLSGRPLTSGELMAWGELGRGKEFTVFANAGHVFIVIEAGVHKGDAWGTATRDLEGQPGSGPLYHHHTTSGFVARHAPGH